MRVSLPTISAAAENTHHVANATLLHEGGWDKRPRLDDSSDADGLDSADDEDTNSSDEKVPPSAIAAEDEERALSKPSISAEPLWVKLFYKIFPLVERPAPVIKHRPLRPPHVEELENGMVTVSFKR
ncbi:hypothetical protein ON010_g9350 [Phytophthora cinnamomi]|nr:hypothetical protein ON010_g9350 [Phytophthora cinnamomi]